MPQQSKSPKPRLNQAAPAQTKASKPSPVPTRHASVGQASKPLQSQPPVTRTEVTKVESGEDEDDWSDVSELQEIDLKPLQAFKDQNGNVNKKNYGKGQSLLSVSNKVRRAWRYLSMHRTC